MRQETSDAPLIFPFSKHFPLPFLSLSLSSQAQGKGKGKEKGKTKQDFRQGKTIGRRIIYRKKKNLLLIKSNEI